jgi:hypothetical protein
MKVLKIVLGIFCIALTINAFKNGLEPGENIFYYIPITIVFIIGILLFKNASKSK